MDQRICVTKTLKIIGAKWTISILSELCQNTRRFNELHHSLPGISPKTLSLRLTQLETNGVIKKKVFAEVPPRVEYSLTPKGSSLRSIIEQMRSWGESH